MKAKIHITLKNGVLDPQGQAIASALHNMGYGDVEEVRQGKYIEVDLKNSAKGNAKETVDKICSSLLANTVVENYKYELVD